MKNGKMQGVDAEHINWVYYFTFTTGNFDFKWFLHTNTFPKTAINFYGWITLSEELTVNYDLYKGLLSET